MILQFHSGCIGEQNNVPTLDLPLCKMVLMLLLDSAFKRVRVEEMRQRVCVCVKLFNIQTSSESLMNNGDRVHPRQAVERLQLAAAAVP